MASLVVLCGGKSDRIGRDKALMQFLGRPLISRMLDRLAFEMDEIILSCNFPEKLSFLELPVIEDLIPNSGALGGLYSAMSICEGNLTAAVACDMPFANPSLFEYEFDLLSRTGVDVVIPETPGGLEPFHAVYRRDACLPAIRSSIEAGEYKVIKWLSQVSVRRLLPEEILRFDSLQKAFININTEKEFQRAEDLARDEKTFQFEINV